MNEGKGPQPVDLRGWAALLAIGLPMGSSFLLIAVVLEVADPLLLVTGRSVMGVALLVPLSRVMGARVSSLWSVRGQLVVLTALNIVVPFWLMSWGQTHIHSGTAALLVGTSPAFTAVFATLLLRDERLYPGQMAGVAAGLSGVALVAGPDFRDFSGMVLLGDLAVVGAAVCWGLASPLVRIMVPHEHPMGLTAATLLLAAVWLVPLVALVDRPETLAFPPKIWLAWVALSAGGSGLGTAAFYWLINRLGAVRSSVVNYIIPGVAVLLGWVVLDEGVGPATLGGLLLIVASVALVNRMVLANWRGRSAVAPAPRLTVKR